MAQTAAQIKAVEEYWRPDRLKKADDSTPKTADPKPAAAASASSFSASSSTAETASSSTAETSTAETTTARAAATQSAAAQAATASAPTSGTVTNASTDPWTLQPAPPAKKTSAPSATVGKVFFRIGTKDFWCSASAVRAQNRSLVATAGHCAFDLRLNKSVENWVFVPAYRAGSQPAGIYVGHTLSTHIDYAKGDYDYDYAFVTVTRGFTWQATKDAKGQATYRRVDVGLLQDNVGGQGITVSRGESIMAAALGYPAGPQPDGSRPYNGHSLKACAGLTRKVASPTYMLDRGIAIKGCDFTAGASGGPWLIGYNKATGTGLLNGINSLSWNRKVDGKNDEISSPFFTAATQVVYNYAQGLTVS
jgi:hypothetical protein